MAKAHNSKLVEARRRARELATAQQERHEKLIELAESYFVVTGEADSAVAIAKEAAEKLVKDARAKGVALVEEAREQMTEKWTEAQKVVAEMVETGASVSDVASRLDMTAAAVRAAVKSAASEKNEPAQGEPADTPAEHDGHAA